MPNRIIKESFTKSEKIAKLTDFEFRLWVTLITLADDYGCGDARPEIIKGSGFPFRERLSLSDIEHGLAKLAAVGCITLYKVDGISYLQFPHWFDHQRQRKTKHKFPLPPHTDGDGCVNLRQVAAGCGLESESESESESEIESESNASCAELPEDGRSSPEPSEFSIPLNDGTVYNVPLGDIETYKSLYPGVNVSQQLRNMIGWSMGNPSRRKTKLGVKRFINSWLMREQDSINAKGGRNGAVNGRPAEERSARRISDETIL